MEASVRDLSELTFAPPGPGSWQVAASQMPRPWPLFQTEIHPDHLTAGFSATGRRYGLLLDRLEYRFVHGFAYISRKMVDPAEIPERTRTAERAFADKLWRHDMDRWDSEVKPQAVKANLALQAVDPAGLSTEALLEHIDRCREHYQRMVYEQHFHNGAALVPLGDFLAHAIAWTKLPLGQLVEALRGAAPVSGGASGERDRLVSAIKSDPDAQALLGADVEPAQILENLRGASGEVGTAAGTYLDMFGYRLLDGVEVSNPYALEKPDVLVRSIRAGVTDQDRPHEPTLTGIEAIRGRVPEDQRGEFDSMLEEARYTYRLRDERGVYTVAWAGGILRRALLETGRRLVAEGRLQQPEHVVEAGYAELRALVEGEGGPSAEELARRAGFRARFAAADAPQHLGSPAGPPPPMDRLLPPAARAMRAVNIVMGALFAESEAQSEARVVRGLGASPGVYTGTARLVSGPDEFHRVEQGDVIVTRTTSEAFNIILPMLGAVVTDSGGLLSHAAIVAREYGIPGIVGSRDATKVIADGAQVRVDGGSGEVTVLG